MRISHTEFEMCRKNPREWVSKKTKNLIQIRMGYDGLTKRAIYMFHRTKSAAEAQAHLSRLLNKFNLKNTVLRDKAQEKLNSYIEWFNEESPAVSECGLRLDYDLGNGWVLGGEISRVDIDIESGGYRGVLISNRPPSWQQQLRFPLIQRALSARLQRPETLISVGFQNLIGTQLEVISFPKSRLDEVEAMAKELAKVLSGEWHRQKRI